MPLWCWFPFAEHCFQFAAQRIQSCWKRHLHHNMMIAWICTVVSRLPKTECFGKSPMVAMACLHSPTKLMKSKKPKLPVQVLRSEIPWESISYLIICDWTELITCIRIPCASQPDPDIVATHELPSPPMNSSTDSILIDLCHHITRFLLGC